MRILFIVIFIAIADHTAFSQTSQTTVKRETGKESETKYSCIPPVSNTKHVDFYKIKYTKWANATSSV